VPSESSHVVAARAASAGGDWSAARHHLQTGDAGGPLETVDLELLGRATWLLGDRQESMSDAELLFGRLIALDRPVDAARLALRLSLEWALRGELQIGTAWLGRADRLLAAHPDLAAGGFLTYVRASMELDIEGDPALAECAARQVELAARESGDPALECFAQVLSGMAAVRSGRTAEGFAALDEAMLPIVAGRVDPLWAGDVYCSVIHLCEGLADLARMRAWTDALERWAMPLSRTFIYAVVTRIHQLQLICAEGDWDVVEQQIGEQSRQVAGAHVWVAGAGFMELGDVRRLRGDHVAARAAYQRAGELGLDPQPGAALLLRAEGRCAEALDALRASLSQRDRLGRARLLLAAVELSADAGELAEADQYAAELAGTAQFYGTPGLVARSQQGRAAVALARGRPAAALPLLDAAVRVYREQRFRYAIATVHEQLGNAHRALGDAVAAGADIATARTIYEQLGAIPDLNRLASRHGSPTLPGGLTSRELQILTCVASGASNREVAETLVISDKTVGRHLANIFAKLGVSTRTAAAAWAHEHGIKLQNRD
jgi:DNA-binding CsgD family transcriptional regulator